MAKLVVLNQGMSGRVHELTAQRTTVGRVEDNVLQIGDPSVSSHHCEVEQRGGEIWVRDLNSTNGSYIDNARISESVLKAGQTLRLGQVELRLEVEGAAAAAPPAQSAPPAKKAGEAPMAVPRGVSLDQLEQGGRKGAFDTARTIFKKKRNKTGQYFWIGAGIVITIILVLIMAVMSQLGKGR
ncbi:MAG: FHA domain-containing protein [Verrucomicrobia bacterium]|nr:FHA domain-containing protein [Verrucomicrobiota bacterium]MDE3098584.1 FHA domain-containing protein [Verrucomicrobiota bacterium]